MDPIEHLLAGDQLLAAPRAVGIERHELDEPDHPAGVPGEGGEVEDLVVVPASDQDHVHLEGREAGPLGRVHGLQHDVQLAAAPDRPRTDRVGASRS